MKINNSIYSTVGTEPEPQTDDDASLAKEN
jgi:hypothetical protein